MRSAIWRGAERRDMGSAEREEGCGPGWATVDRAVWVATVMVDLVATAAPAPSARVATMAPRPCSPRGFLMGMTNRL